MTMMISQNVNDRLNEQIKNELSSYYSYLAMACMLTKMSLKVLARFFERQANEEREHAMKFMRYLENVDGEVILETLPAPKADFTSPLEIAREALDNEWMVTRQINELVTLTEKENDYATRSFLTWFVDEQVEEVSSMRDLLQLIERGQNNLILVEAQVAGQMLSNPA